MKRAQLGHQLKNEAQNAIANRELKIVVIDEAKNTGSGLTAGEVSRLEHCENVLERGLHTFFEVGIALLTIRDERLYRATHHTFESYCKGKWGMGKSYAWRVIGAAERLRLLPPDGTLPRPTSEFQVRPFLEIEPQLFPKAWEQAVARAQGGKVTPRIVKSLIAEFRPDGATASTERATQKQNNKVSKRGLGEVLTWLQVTRRRIESGDKERALAGLERVEAVLQRFV